MKKVWERRLDDEAVSPVIAVILMVAITVVLAAVLYVTVQQMAETQTSITPTGSLQVKESSSNPKNYTISLIGLSDDVEYEDFYITVSTNDRNLVIGSTTEGIAAATWAAGVTSSQHGSDDAYANYTSSTTSPADSTKLTAGDVLKLTTQQADDVWDGAEIKFIYIPTGGLIASKLVD